MLNIIKGSGTIKFFFKSLKIFLDNKQHHLVLQTTNLVLDNTRHNQEFKIQTEILNDSLDMLSSKVDSLCTHNKMLETQISQVASSSQTSGFFPSQPKANPKG